MYDVTKLRDLARSLGDAIYILDSVIKEMIQEIEEQKKEKEEEK